MKTARTLHTDEHVARIRENIETYASARAIADDIIAKAEPWTKRSDDWLYDLPPPADIFRGFHPSFDGCPIHGMEVMRAPGGPWKLDVFNRPWKIQCAIGGEDYPSNDFLEYYKTKDKSLLTGDFADDGS